MFAGWKRWRRALEDWLRYHPLSRGLVARAKLWRDAFSPRRTADDLAWSIQRLCAAARFSSNPDRVRFLQTIIQHRLTVLKERELHWAEFVDDIDDLRLHKAAILKPYLGPREKGVIFIAFEREWIKLLRLSDRRAFAERYHLVVSPSSSPHNLINYVFPAVYPAPVFTLISNLGDQEALPGVSANLIVVPLYASQWVNPDLFTPLPKKERAWDLLMVASWGKVKRHHVLFKALRRMSRRWRVLLVGQDQEGRTAATIQQEAGWYGVQDRFTLLANQPYAEVAKVFAQARASAVLSRREGSCVVVAESFCADTPVALLAGAEIGSRVFINDRTGCFLEERSLARQLEAFLERADEYRPRAWAMDNISCYHSTRVLNDFLRDHSLKQGGVWTQDLAPLMWSPDPCLARPADRQRLEPERREIMLRFGLEVGKG